MTPETSTSTERGWDRLALAALALGICAQWTSEIRWGDGLELVAASAGLGVAHPPGYPLFTGLGWLALRLPMDEPYAAVLWVSRAAAIGATFGLYLWLRRMLAGAVPDAASRCAAAALLTLAFAFGGSLWPALRVVEVYVLNAALLVWIVVLAGQPGAARVVGAAALLGCALANHLSAACLAPLVALSLWRSARATRRLGPALLGGALLLGIPALLYGTLPLRSPGAGGYGLGWGVEDLGSLLEHLRGGDYGTALFLRAEPETPFTFAAWSAFAADRWTLLVRSLGGIFVGSTRAALAAGWVALALVAYGYARALRQEGPLGRSGLVLLAVSLQLGFIFTYNIPDAGDYLLGVHVLVLPYLGAGLARAARIGARVDRGLGLPVAAAVLLATAAAATWRDAYPESRGLDAVWTDRLVEALPLGASLVAWGDEEMFALWYRQMARGERRDLLVYPAAPIVRRPWVRATMPLGDPRRDAVGFRPGRPRGFDPALDELRRLAIEPLLGFGPVYMATYNEMEFADLRRHYTLVPAAVLLETDELRLMIREGRRPIGPPYLWELRPLTP